MARISRIVVPDIPSHITQRGNRRQQTFFCNEDCQLYLDLLAQWCRRFQVEIWAYCLMPNHVHLIAVPSTQESLAKAIGETHERYTRHVNFREGWRGHLWQGRFASYPMDETHLLAVARYIEINPVKAKIAARPQDYRWSSARVHLTAGSDRVVCAAPLLELVPNWKDLLAEPMSEEQEKTILRHGQTGRPLGNEDFIAKLEAILGRILRRRRPGPKPKTNALVGAMN